MSRNNLKVPKKNPPAKKQWKAALLKPLAISPGTSKKSRPKVQKGARPAPVDETLFLLRKYYPGAHCALHFQTPFQLLIATILSAQCTDERVNQVTPHLFAQYPSAFEMGKARVEDLEEIIRPTGFYRNKAKNLKSCSEILVEKHQGQIPQVLEDLVELPGVGRKTANVVLGNAFDITSGIVVDTHVTRLSNRLGWTRTENAVLIEQDLQKIIPRKDWILFSHWLISHGRAVCKARKPSCDTCFLFEQCPKILKNS